MTIRPSLRVGAKTALRAPTTTCTWPAGDAPPVAAALGVAEMAVQHRHLAAAAAEALDGLRRQADLRHQHQRLLALAHHFLDGPQVDLRLAAAGDAVQQERAGSRPARSAGSSGRPRPQLIRRSA